MPDNINTTIMPVKNPFSRLNSYCQQVEGFVKQKMGHRHLAVSNNEDRMLILQDCGGKTNRSHKVMKVNCDEKLYLERLILTIDNSIEELKTEKGYDLFFADSPRANDNSKKLSKNGNYKKLTVNKFKKLTEETMNSNEFSWLYLLESVDQSIAEQTSKNKRKACSKVIKEMTGKLLSLSIDSEGNRKNDFDARADYLKSKISERLSGLQFTAAVGKNKGKTSVSSPINKDIKTRVVEEVDTVIQRLCQSSKAQPSPFNNKLKAQNEINSEVALPIPPAHNESLKSHPAEQITQPENTQNVKKKTSKKAAKIVKKEQPKSELAQQNKSDDKTVLNPFSQHSPSFASKSSQTGAVTSTAKRQTSASLKVKTAPPEQVKVQTASKSTQTEQVLDVKKAASKNEQQKSDIAQNRKSDDKTISSQSGKNQPPLVGKLPQATAVTFVPCEQHSAKTVPPGHAQSHAATAVQKRRGKKKRNGRQTRQSAKTCQQSQPLEKRIMTEPPTSVVSKGTSSTEKKTGENSGVFNGNAAGFVPLQFSELEKEALTFKEKYASESDWVEPGSNILDSTTKSNIEKIQNEIRLLITCKASGYKIKIISKLENLLHEITENNLLITNDYALKLIAFIDTNFFSNDECEIYCANELDALHGYLEDIMERNEDQKSVTGLQSEPYSALDYKPDDLI